MGTEGKLGNKIIDFQYDPESIKATKSLSYTQKKILKMAQPLISFSSGEAQQMSFDLIFDAHHDPDKDDVASDLNALRDLAVPRDSGGNRIVKPPSHGQSLDYGVSEKIGGVPPRLVIALGIRVWPGFMSKIDVTEQKHGTTGGASYGNKVTRAEVTLEFLVVEEEQMFVDF